MNRLGVVNLDGVVTLSTAQGPLRAESIRL
jgi:hypothetical protein